MDRNELESKTAPSYIVNIYQRVTRGEGAEGRGRCQYIWSDPEDVGDRIKGLQEIGHGIQHSGEEKRGRRTRASNERIGDSREF